MAFIPAPGAIKIVMLYTGGQGQLVNTLWASKPPPVTLTDLQNAAFGAGSWFNNSLKPVVANLISLTAVSAYDMSAQNAPVFSTTSGLPSAGTHGGEPLAINASLVISWRTANRGRSGRGRFYCPPCSETGVADGYKYTVATQALVATAAAALAGVLSASGLQHSIVSFFLNKVPRAAGLIQQVTGFVVDQAIDSQRRRLLGRGV